MIKARLCNRISDANLELLMRIAIEGPELINEICNKYMPKFVAIGPSNCTSSSWLFDICMHEGKILVFSPPVYYLSMYSETPPPNLP